MACPNQRFKQMLSRLLNAKPTLKERMKAMTTMTAFILSVIISLVAQTDAQCFTNAHIQASVDVLDEKITAMMGLSTMMAEFGQKIVVLEEEVKNLAGICSRSCSDGWSDFERSCYRLVEQKMSWDDAMTNCKHLGKFNEKSCGLFF